MNNRVLVSLSMIGVVAAIVIGGTVAYFSDTETSSGNTFTAGTLDLKVDNECYYNGEFQKKCSWQETDLTDQKFFNFNDIKPGDHGEDTISLHVYDNDAHLCAYVTNLTNAENGCNEPEGNVDETCDKPGVGKGELQDNIYVTIWRDTGVEGVGDCDNELQEGEEILVNNEPIDNSEGGWYLGVLPGSKTTCLGVRWNVPSDVGNIIQSDSVTGDISFYTEQYRHQEEGFECPETPPQP
ncbi:MAG: TasA family protein [candidate division WOR-3 bacterium]